MYIQKAKIISKKTAVKLDCKDEMLDIYCLEANSDDGVTLHQTGSSSRSEAHNDGLLHLAAHVWIYNDVGQILVQKRSQNVVAYPGKKYISAGGHINTGETILNAARRELYEELGIWVDESRFDLIYEDYDNVCEVIGGREWKNHEYTFVYVVNGDYSTRDLHIQETEVESVEYMSVSDFTILTMQTNQFVPEPKAYYDAVINAISSRINKIS